MAGVGGAGAAGGLGLRFGDRWLRFDRLLGRGRCLRRHRDRGWRLDVERRQLLDEPGRPAREQRRGLSDGLVVVHVRHRQAPRRPGGRHSGPDHLVEGHQGAQVVGLVGGHRRAQDGNPHLGLGGLRVQDQLGLAVADHRHPREHDVADPVAGQGLLGRAQPAPDVDAARLGVVQPRNLLTHREEPLDAHAWDGQLLRDRGAQPLAEVDDAAAGDDTRHDSGDGTRLCDWLQEAGVGGHAQRV